MMETEWLRTSLLYFESAYVMLYSILCTVEYFGNWVFPCIFWAWLLKCQNWKHKLLSHYPEWKVLFLSVI